MGSTWIYQIVITCVIGIIAYFLKDTKKLFDDRFSKLDKDIKETLQKSEKNIKEHTEKIDQLREDFNEHKEDVSKEYVRKSDYLQTTGEIMKKLDKIFDILLDMKGK